MVLGIILGLVVLSLIILFSIGYAGIKFYTVVNEEKPDVARDVKILKRLLFLGVIINISCIIGLCFL